MHWFICIYTYIYIHICTFMYIYVYIYIRVVIFIGEAPAQGGQGWGARIVCARGDWSPLQSRITYLYKHAHHTPKHYYSYSQAKRQRKVDRAEANASTAHEETGSHCKAELFLHINTHITNPNTTIRIRRPSGSARWTGPKRTHRLRTRRRDPTAKQA